MMSHKFIPGIASQSLGNPQYHDLKSKLFAAGNAGLESIEIFFEDLAQVVRAYTTNQELVDPKFVRGATEVLSEQEILFACARQVGQWCVEAGLEVICLQPFMHYEGSIDRQQHRAKIAKLHVWIEVAKCLGTTLIQVPSNFSSPADCTGDRDQLIADLRELAEVGARHNPPIRFAHEGLCWGTYTHTWEAAWDLVQAVDMDNFGTCLDTFNILGRIYADPESSDRKTPDAEQVVEASMQRLREIFRDPKNRRKIFYVELCDGEWLQAPLVLGHDWYNPEQPARMTWSRNARLFPFEADAQEAQAQEREAGYLPILQVLDAILDIGFEGYLSFEVFNRSLNREGWDVVPQHAMRAKQSWQRCAEYIDAYFRGKDAAIPGVARSENKAIGVNSESRRIMPWTGQGISVLREAGVDSFTVQSRL